MREVWTICVALLAAVPASSAPAQDYPSRPIRFIVPFGAGGVSDSAARIIGRKMTERLGQQVVVENRVGAGGTIGSELAAKSKPDGYTLLLGSSTELAANPNLYRKLPYDTTRDFSAVALVSYTPLLVVVHPSLPVRTMKDLQKLAKARPGELNYASTGNGSTVHLGTEMFKKAAGIDMLHIPQTTTAQASVMGGQTQLMFASMPSAIGLVRGGRLRAIAVTSRERFPAAPEIPTVIESGFPGVEIVIWNAIMAPSGVPRDILSRLEAEVTGILKATDTRQDFSNLGMEVTPRNAEYLAGFLKSELAKYAKLVADSGARID